MNEVELSDAIAGIKVMVIVRDFSDDVNAATHEFKGQSLHDAIDTLYEKLKGDLSRSFINDEQGK